MRVVVGRVGDFSEGDRRIIEVNGKSVGVFCVEGRFYALRNRCPHQFGPLCEGTLLQRATCRAPGEDIELDDGPPLLACPWHGWEYDLATGQSFLGPGHGNAAARRYVVSVERGTELETARARADGRVPGPYVAETVTVAVEDDYVVVED